MTGRQYRRARANLGSLARRRQDRLAPGALRQAVLEHLRTHPHTDFSAAELGNALRRPNSRSAITAACRHWIATGRAVQTRCGNNRYQAAPDTTGNGTTE